MKTLSDKQFSMIRHSSGLKQIKIKEKNQIFVSRTDLSVPENKKKEEEEDELNKTPIDLGVERKERKRKKKKEKGEE